METPGEFCLHRDQQRGTVIPGLSRAGNSVTEDFDSPMTGLPVCETSD